MSWLLILRKRPQIVGVGGFSEGVNRNLKLLRIHPTISKSNFLEAGDFEALMVLDGADKLRGFQERLVGASVEPGVSATENLDMEIAAWSPPGRSVRPMLPSASKR